MGNCFSATAPATITVYVTYKPKGVPCPLTLSKGNKKAELEAKVLQCFAHVILPNCQDLLEYMCFDKGEKKFVKLTENHFLQDNDIVNFNLKCACVQSGSPAHTINDNHSYYFWSNVSQVNDGIMKKGPQIQGPTKNDLYEVKCNGKSDDPADIIHFKARVVTVSGGPPLFMFTLPSSTPNKVFALKGLGEDMDVVIEEIDEADVKSSPTHMKFKFQPMESFSYTLYQWQDPGDRVDLYLAAFKDGSVTVTKGGQPGYPKPSTLFITISMI